MVAAVAGLLVAAGMFRPVSLGGGVWIMLAIDAICLVAAVPVAFALAAGSLGLYRGDGNAAAGRVLPATTVRGGELRPAVHPVLRPCGPGDGLQRHVAGGW